MFQSYYRLRLNERRSSWNPHTDFTPTCHSSSPLPNSGCKPNLPASVTPPPTGSPAATAAATDPGMLAETFPEPLRCNPSAVV